MRAIRAAEPGGPDVLRLEALPVPAPGPGQALVRVDFAGVNFIDVYHRKGAYPMPKPIPIGREGAGTVIDVGTGVALAPGARVAWCAVPGSYATHVLASAEQLVGYHWPGNIRELESTVSRAALSAPGRFIRPTDIEFLHAPLARPAEEAANPRLPTLRDAERAHIIRVLDATSWNKVEAARVLDISRGTLYRKIDEFGLEPTTPDSKRRVKRSEPDA